MRYDFHPAALEEYLEAALWYANRDQNVALKFIACVEDAIDRVVELPLLTGAFEITVVGDINF